MKTTEGFEEWWNQLPYLDCDNPRIARRVDGYAFSKLICKVLYDSIKSRMRPITDEEVVRRFNELVGKNAIQFSTTTALGGTWYDSVDRIFRLKPAPKPAWEVAWEKEVAQSYPFGEPDGREKRNFIRGFEAGQKEATNE